MHCPTKSNFLKYLWGLFYFGTKLNFVYPGLLRTVATDIDKMGDGDSHNGKNCNSFFRCQLLVFSAMHMSLISLPVLWMSCWWEIWRLLFRLVLVLQNVTVGFLFCRMGGWFLFYRIGRLVSVLQNRMAGCPIERQDWVLLQNGWL